MNEKHVRFFIILVIQVLLLSGCDSKDSSSFSDQGYQAPAASTGGKRLAVLSGSCYAGGLTVSAGSSTVALYNMDGTLDKLLVDYNTFSIGDQPISVVEYDEENLLVLVENTAGRRLDLIRKDGSSIQTFLTNSTALSGVVRALVEHHDQGFLISKSTAIEKFSRSKGRVLQGANPFVNAPAGTCATSTTLISSVQSLSNGKIIFAHAAATPNNKIGVISTNGYSVAGDCLAATAAPVTTALPSALLVHSSGQLLVGYASTTLASNFIYAYDVNATSGAITGATQAFNNVGVVYGPTAIAEDTETGDVYIANGGFNSIEKFTYNSTTKQLSLSGSVSFVYPQIYSRCVAGMKVINL